MTHRLLIGFVIAAGCLFSGIARSGSEDPRSDAIPLPGKIQRGDLLEVLIIGINGPYSQCLKRMRVDAEGMARPVYLQSGVKVAGLSPSEAADAIRRGYIDAMADGIDWIDVARIESGEHPSVKPGPIKAGDMIEVSVSDIRGPNCESILRIQLEANGDIALPCVGIVNANGLSEVQLEDRIVLAYREANLIQHAQVNVLKIATADQSIPKLGLIELGDLLRFRVPAPNRASDQTTYEIRVGADGRAGFPLLGGVKIAGMRVADAAVLLEKSYVHSGNTAMTPISLEKIECNKDPQRLPGPIQNGDVVRIAVGGIEGPDTFFRNFRVDEDGNVRLPYVPRLKLAGLSECDAQQAIEKAYHAMPDMPIARKLRIAVLKIAPAN